MPALGAAVKHHVTVSQSNSAEYGRCRTDRKRQENPVGGQRNIGDAREAFVVPIDVQILQFQPCQSCLESSGTCYREVDAYVAKCGCVTIRIAKRKCTAFRHLSCPIGPADYSCDQLKVLRLTELGSIKQLDTFDYAASELRM